jgi:2-methylcitrate dehydratase PrpD
VFFRDGSMSRRVAVDFPIGHRKRRAEGMPVLVQKFESSVAAQFSPLQARAITSLCADRVRLEGMRVDDFVAQLVSPGTPAN